MSDFSEENAMCIVATMVAEELADILGVSETDALRLFLASRTGELLFDPDLKMWWDGPASVTDAYLGEIGAAPGDDGVLRSEPPDEMEARTRGQRVAEGIRRGSEEIASGRFVTREDYERDRTRRREAV